MEGPLRRTPAALKFWNAAPSARLAHGTGGDLRGASPYLQGPPLGCCPSHPSRPRLAQILMRRSQLEHVFQFDCPAVLFGGLKHPPNGSDRDIVFSGKLCHCLALTVQVGNDQFFAAEEAAE
jgi:hypothetical protein